MKEQAQGSDNAEDHTPETGSLVDKQGFDDVMRGLLAVKPGKDKPANKRTEKKPEKKS